MSTLKINIKAFFLSIWNIILIAGTITVSIMCILDADGNAGFFTYRSNMINVFLGVIMPIFSVFAVHNIKDIEYSLIHREKLIFLKYIAVNIFCCWPIAVPILIIVVYGVINAVAFNLLITYICYIFILTLTESIFLTAIGFALAFAIKNKSAYFLAVIISLIFSPFYQNIVWDNYYYLIRPIKDFMYALLNLINITDETPFLKYTGYGMPFNSETILSWIITLLIGITIFCFVLLFKKSSKGFKPQTAIIPLICTVTIIFAVICTNFYFVNSPIEYAYGWTDRDDDFIQDPPTKVDTIDIFDEGYTDKNSSLVKEYQMDLKTGNTVKNTCTMIIETFGNKQLKLKLDECFSINYVLLNDVEIPFVRDGNYFYINISEFDNYAQVTVDYSGRMNYVDGLRNKMDFCDFTGGYLTHLFAWYPKIITERNCQQQKHFIINIDAVNTFVSNLNDCKITNSGKSKIEGYDKEVFFYIGYICEIEVNGYNVIMPLEYKNNNNSVERIKAYIFELQDKDSIIFTDKSFFEEYDGINDSSYTDDEVIDAFKDWLKEHGATNEQKEAVNTLIFTPGSYNSAIFSFIYSNYYISCEFTLF